MDRSPPPATVERGEFLLSFCFHLAAGDSCDSPPPAAAPAAGGWGIAGSRRVHSVGSSWASAGGVLEAESSSAVCLRAAFVPSGSGAPRRSKAERRPLLRARGPPGSPCAEIPPPDLLAVDLVDFMVAGADGASGDDDGAGWRPLEVRVSKTSRPPGGCFRSKVFRKLRRRRVFDAASSPATSMQKDRCVMFIFCLIFSAYSM